MTDKKCKVCIVGLDCDDEEGCHEIEEGSKWFNSKWNKLSEVYKYCPNCGNKNEE